MQVLSLCLLAPADSLHTSPELTHARSYAGTNQYTQAAAPTGTGTPTGQEVSDYYLLVGTRHLFVSIKAVSLTLYFSPTHLDPATRDLNPRMPRHAKTLSARSTTIMLSSFAAIDRLHQAIPRRSHSQLSKLEIRLLSLVRLHRSLHHLDSPASIRSTLWSRWSIMAQYSDAKDIVWPAQSSEEA